MSLSRRVFIAASLSLSASIGGLCAAQEDVPPPQFPPPFPRPEPPDSPRNKKRDRVILKANRETITKDVTRMSELVDALQKQLKESDTTDILSLDVLRKSEEIEKLARHVRDLVRG
jgi:hypothetical protein